MEEKKHSNTINTIRASQNLKYILVIEGIMVGLVAGTITILYRLALGKGEVFLSAVLKMIDGDVMNICGWFLALIIMALIVSILLKWEPLISGSGIPQVEGEMSGYLDQNWFKIIIAKIIAGILCIFGGLSLGREGPSIQLGAMAGKGLSRFFKRVKVEEKFLLTCGASAGLSAAFNAPLAGIMFALEEIHKNFSVSVLVSVMSASVMADFLSQYIFGLQPAFHFVVEHSLPLGYYMAVLILGIVVGVFGAFYNYCTLKTQNLYEKIPFLKPQQRVIIPFLMAGVLGICLPQVLGSGHAMIEMLSDGEFVLKSILILLAVKFIFSMVSFGSGAPGGIFFPLLVLGSFIGAAFGLIAHEVFAIPDMYIVNFIIMAMAGYFTAIVRAPITGIILIAEMTGTLTHLLSLSVVSIVAYVTANLLKSEPIYESLLERILKRRGITQCGESGVRILIETVVQLGSYLDGRSVSQVEWPKSCLLVSIERNGNEIVPKGDTQFLPGDTIVALVPEVNMAIIQDQIQRYCAQGGV